MRQLVKDIDVFLNEVILQVENQYEILIGYCISEVVLINIQEYIFMFLLEEFLINLELVCCFNVSQAVVIKVIKFLVKEGMLEIFKDFKDVCVIFYQLIDLVCLIVEEYYYYYEYIFLIYE